MSVHAAIPTTYRGIQMRSRLEAKWAAYFDLRGDTKWEYEPIDLDGWIPDFTVKIPVYPLPVLGEVKPIYSIESFIHTADSLKMLRACRNIAPTLHNTFGGVLLLGVSPEYTWLFLAGTKTGWHQLPGPNKRLQQRWREAGSRVQWKSPR